MFTDQHTLIPACFCLSLTNTFAACRLFSSTRLDDDGCRQFCCLKHCHCNSERPHCEQSATMCHVVRRIVMTQAGFVCVRVCVYFYLVQIADRKLSTVASSASEEVNYTAVRTFLSRAIHAAANLILDAC